MRSGKKVFRTEIIRVRKSDHISSLCHASKNLYNSALYLVRQALFKQKRRLRYPELDKLLKKDEDYRSLPAATAQHVLKQVDHNMLSFFRSAKEYSKHAEKFLGRPRLPHYLKKNGENILFFTNRQCHIRNCMLIFPHKVDLSIKTRFSSLEIREVRIVPKGTAYNIEIVYTKIIKPPVSESGSNRVLGIDLGVRNLVTIANSVSSEGIAVRAGAISSINEYFNKRLAFLRSIQDRQHLVGKGIGKLYDTRNGKIYDLMHKLSGAIVEYAISLRIDTIVIGNNPRWKNRVDLGSKNNRSFVQIPFQRMILMIRYKAEETGIRVIVIEEDHTSKCSFIDRESVEHHEKYQGKRISRGLFRSKDGTLIHADLNAAYNIIARAIPEAFADGIEGIGLYPRGLSIAEMIAPKNVTRA